MLLALIGSLYYDYSPIIVSRAYNEKFTANGTAYDLTSYFRVYYGEDELVDVPLKLAYYTDDYGKPGEALESDPSKPVNGHKPGGGKQVISNLGKPVPVKPHQATGVK